jgi:CheY-like chemotaxis protein
VLIVEDNAAVRDVTRQRLIDLGYIVVEAETGPAAIDALEAGVKADLVFSDVVMTGGLTGFDVARTVRERWPRTRILLTSGYPDDLLRRQEGALQDLLILRKPYSRADLAAKLREVFDA